MLKKEIAYTDFNGNQQTEEYYFHMNKMDVVKIMKDPNSHLAKYLESHEDVITRASNEKLTRTELESMIKDKKAYANQSPFDMLMVIHELIIGSVGTKSDDGKLFIKTDEAKNNFESSAAYNSLFDDFTEGNLDIMEFFTRVIPQGLLVPADPQSTGSIS